MRPRPLMIDVAMMLTRGSSFEHGDVSTLYLAAVDDLSASGLRFRKRAG